MMLECNLKMTVNNKHFHYIIFSLQLSRYIYNKSSQFRNCYNSYCLSSHIRNKCTKCSPSNSSRMDTCDRGVSDPFKSPGVAASGLTGITKRVGEVSLNFNLQLNPLVFK